MFFLASIQGFSQTNKVKVSGVVLENNGQAAEGVSVALKGTAYSTLTNEKGEYEITAEPGNYVLVVTYVGYKSKQTKIKLEQANVTVPSISIEEDIASLEEVSVVGKSKVQRVQEQPFNVAAVDLKMVHNSSADLNQVLGRTTGVRVRETGGMGSNFNFSLNGFSGNQVKFFMDGIPIDSYGSSFTLNNIPVNLAERIEVYKGVVPIELGSDALGGAVNIITNQSVKRYVDASYSFGSFNTHKLAINTRFSGKKGFVANINAFGNYSDNSYKVDVSVADASTGAFGPEQKYKHFHDGYKSGGIMAEVGVKNKKYADYLLFGMMASANEKEIQTGTTMQRVVGDAFTDSKALVSSLKFKKDTLFTKNLSVNLIASYSIVNSRAVDTSSYRYKWDGSRTIESLNSGGEINREKTIYVYDDKSFQTNTSFKYDLNEQQYLVFNHSLVDLTRKEDDEYRTITKPGSPTLTKNILGLSYNLAAFNRKLSFVAFAKKYFLNTSMIVVQDDYADDKQYDVLKSSFDDLGYGTALAYFLTSEIQLKGSYEHSFRLPAAEEMLGDGLLLLPTPGLKPESSDNLNAGLSFKKAFNKHSFGFQGNFIYRNAKDFIQIETQGAQSQYANIADVRVTGFDGAIHYGYMNWLTFEVNATKQKTIDTSEFDPPGSNIPNAYKGSQLPNVPIFYANANLGLTFRKIRTSDDNLSINLLASYIDEYYLVSTQNGTPDSRRTIPEQFTQSIYTAYAFGKGKYNLGLECNNIADTKVYDYFKVQKPGRSFTIKFRYFIN
jgi:outer membrane receptor protein involved in Fe transport